MRSYLKNLFLFLFCAAGAQAQAYDAAKVIRWLDNSIDVTACEANTRYGERRLRDFVVSTINDGLFELSKINPDITKAGVEHHLNSRLHFNFRINAPEGAQARFVTERFFILKYDRIELGKLCDRIDLAAYNPDMVSALRGAIFHEFLHYLHLDNQHAEKHSKPKLSYTDSRTPPDIIEDVIYSCGLAVYPDPYLAWYLNDPEVGPLFYEEFGRTCARAKYCGGKTCLHAN